MLDLWISADSYHIIFFPFHQNSSVTNKMYQIHFRPGLCAGSHLGSLGPLVRWGGHTPFPFPTLQLSVTVIVALSCSHRLLCWFVPCSLLLEFVCVQQMVHSACVQTQTTTRTGVCGLWTTPTTSSTASSSPDSSASTTSHRIHIRWYKFVLFHRSSLFLWKYSGVQHQCTW